MIEPWKRFEPTTVTKVGWRTIATKTFRMPDGVVGTYDTIHPDGQEFANVIPLTSDCQVVIARQYRAGPEKIMEELPGGFVDAGETPEEAARRELREETGYDAGTMEYLGAFHKDTFMNAIWHTFLAKDCVKVSGQMLEPTEYIEVDEISIDQLITNATSDALTDHASVLLAYETLRKIQQSSDR